MTFTNLLLLVLNLNVTVGPFLPHDYAVAFQWLKDHPTSDEVILASEPVSVWVPSWVGARVVYGHPFETLYAAQKQQEVLDWYDGNTADCGMLLSKYHVQYIIDGPEEAALGSAPCLANLNQVFQVGSVSVYAP
jgi:hypothetical protein